MTSWGLRLLGLATLLASFMSGPSLIWIGPASLNLFDALFVLTLGVFVVNLAFGGRIPRELCGSSVIGFCYPAAIVTASLCGAILYSYPLGFIVGDIRWVQAVIVGLIILYSYRFRASLVNDLYYVVWVAIIVNAGFVVLQMMAASTGNVAGLLEWWYSDAPVAASRPHGYHLNRFGGAVGQPSGLGFVAAVGAGYALVAMKSAGRQLSLLTGAGLLLVASGSRTALIAAFLLGIGYLSVVGGGRRFRNVIYICVAAVIVIPVAMSFDLGRTAEPQRYRVLLDIATGDADLHDYSGRRGRWRTAVERRNDEYLWLGTLSNPSYVYEDVTIDSGYIHVFARLGPIGLLVLGIFFVAPVMAYLLGRRGRHIALSIVITGIIAVMAINANTFTGLAGKGMTSLAIALLSVKSHPKTQPELRVGEVQVWRK